MKLNQKGSAVLIIIAAATIVLISSSFVFIRSRQENKENPNRVQKSEETEKPAEEEKKPHTTFTITAFSAEQGGEFINASAELEQSLTGICLFSFNSTPPNKVVGKDVKIEESTSCHVSIPTSEFYPGYWEADIFFLSNNVSGKSGKKFLQIR